LSAAQLEVQTGIKMVHVPYRGAQPALTDVVAGHVDMFFDTLATSVPLYRDNKVKLMGVADLKRAGVVPEVPTLSEAGLPGFKSVRGVGRGGAAGAARRLGRKDQARGGGDSQRQGRRRRAAKDAARDRRNGARRHHPFLCRRNGAVEQGDQGGGHRAAVAVQAQAEPKSAVHVSSPASR